MSKRPGDIIISTPVSKVRRRLNFDSPYTNRVVAPTVRVTRSKIWANRPMYRKPKMYRMYRSPDVPKGCEGPCKVQSYEQRDDVKHTGMVRCVSDVTRGSGITHRVGKRFCVKSIYIYWARSGWMRMSRSKIIRTMLCSSLFEIEGLMVRVLKILDKCSTCLIMNLLLQL
uniref:Capsid protein n=1 Tax=East African cassava mosaic Kenya virus TaxID=393599 RepID=Q2A8A3_9GEMI|nr:AV1 protein [East African cassava mosaic Kenya virus]